MSVDIGVEPDVEITVITGVPIALVTKDIVGIVGTSTMTVSAGVGVIASLLASSIRLTINPTHSSAGSSLVAFWTQSIPKSS
jgi:hypothetical protein